MGGPQLLHFMDKNPLSLPPPLFSFPLLLILFFFSFLFLLSFFILIPFAYVLRGFQHIICTRLFIFPLSLRFIYLFFWLHTVFLYLSLFFSISSLSFLFFPFLSFPFFLFFSYLIFSVLYSTLLHLPLLRFHCGSNPGQLQHRHWLSNDRITVLYISSISSFLLLIFPLHHFYLVSTGTLFQSL